MGVQNRFRKGDGPRPQQGRDTVTLSVRTSPARYRAWAEAAEADRRSLSAAANLALDAWAAGILRRERRRRLRERQAEQREAREASALAGAGAQAPALD